MLATPCPNINTAGSDIPSFDAMVDQQTSIEMEGDGEPSQSLEDIIRHVLVDRAKNDKPNSIHAPVNEEHVALVRQAAQDFLRVRHDAEDSDDKSMLLPLINVLFHRYFFLTQLSSPESTAEDSTPFLDYLLSLCETELEVMEESADPSWFHTFHFGLLHDTATIDSSPNTAHEGLDNSVEFIGNWCVALQAAWEGEKSYRLSETVNSPMPWSLSSREEGIPSPPAFFDYDAPVAITIGTSDSPRADLVYFPDIVWYGARHDGYCRSTALSAYVWVRFSTAKTRRDNYALWQSALTFGILEALSGMRIPESLLLSSRADGKTVISRKEVSRFISCWLYDPNAAAADDTPLVRQRVTAAYETISAGIQAINEAAITFLSRDGLLEHTGIDMQEHKDTLCSLYLLYQGLFVILGEQFVNYGLFENTRHGLRRLFIGTPMTRFMGWYEDRLNASGWCPHMASMLSQEIFLIGYAFTVHPYSRSPDFRVSEHTACTADQCVRMNQDVSSYTTQHTPSCRASHTTPCPFLWAPFSHVSNLLSTDQLPVMVYDPLGLTLEVRNANEGSYIAISHVWADGLGSTAEAGLPMCQIARMAAFAGQLLPDGDNAFWVDALCVPKERTLRKKAIMLMAETYRRASKVLVFDAGVRALCTTASPLNDLAFRISTSSWMQRVWTLQEAMLARELYFEVADGLVPITRLNDAMAESAALHPSPFGMLKRDSYMVSLLSGPLQLMFGNGPGSINHLVRAEPVGTYSLDDIILLLHQRTTSRKGDETLAIAGLLEIEPARLLAESDTDMRMRAFWLEMETIPANIMLEMSQARLQMPGFRWAPQTLTTIGGTSDLYGTARCTPAGLTTERPFTLVTFPTIELGGSDEWPDAILLRNVENEESVARYFQRDLRNKIGERTVSANGLVAAPHAFDSLARGAIVDTAFVRIHEDRPHLDCGQEDGPSPEPVVCEYLFELRLEFISLEYVLPHAELSEVHAMFVEYYEAIVVEAKLTEARITVT